MEFFCIKSILCTTLFSHVNFVLYFAKLKGLLRDKGALIYSAFGSFVVRVFFRALLGTRQQEVQVQ